MANGLFFTSSRMEATGGSNDGWYGEKFFDLFTTSMDNNSKWSTPVALPPPVNSTSSDGAAVWDAKNNVLYFTRCGKIKGKEGMCRLYKSVFANAQWGEPETLSFAGEDYNTGHPAINADGSVLYFASDMPGTVGGKDIFMVRWDAGSSNWGTPSNLGTVINTQGDDMYPFLSEEGKLYFASNGHGGMGGLDNYSATEENGVWGNVTNLQSPMNSPADDFGIMFNDAITGFLTSNREGGLGADDIYSFHIPPPIFSVSGCTTPPSDREAVHGEMQSSLLRPRTPGSGCDRPVLPRAVRTWHRRGRDGAQRPRSAIQADAGPR
jgi:peptidoglycan-associated lipoprotein